MERKGQRLVLNGIFKSNKYSQFFFLCFLDEKLVKAIKASLSYFIYIIHGLMVVL